MAKILLADDEKTIFRDPMKAVLVSEGYEVVTAKDGNEAVKRFLAEQPDIVLLDVDMPKKNGYIACQEIRASSGEVPILFLTNKNREADELRGLGYGADDYIAKDVGDAVILARVRAALARQERTAACRPSANPAMVKIGDWRADLKSHVLYAADGSEERLTATESNILSTLVSHEGETFTNDELIAALRGAGYACEDSMLHSHVSRLRRKLGDAAKAIETIRGGGYRYVR